SLSPADALAAIREQNTQAAGGALGDKPIAHDAALNATILTQNRFTEPEEFGAIILRADADGSLVRLRDVARVELGAASYGFGAELDGQPTAGMAVQLTPGANALEVAESVRERLTELERSFPTDIQWSVPFDSTPF